MAEIQVTKIPLIDQSQDLGNVEEDSDNFEQLSDHEQLGLHTRTQNPSDTS